MDLKQRIEEDLKTAVRSKDSLRTSCLRMVKAAIKNKEIEVRGELKEEKLLPLLATLAKQRRESIEQFRKGGREDLAQKEEAELQLIESYLPKALSEAEITKIIDAAVTESGAKGPSDMGKVMKVLMPKVAGRAEGQIVSQLVKKRLAGR